MKKYLFIGTGGFFGATLRVLIKHHSIPCFNGVYLNTFLTNIIGSFLLALFLTLILSTLNVSENIKLLVSTGFLGSFTTFSTLCKEAVIQIHNNIFNSMIYIFSSVILGLTLGFLGIFLGEYVNKNLKLKR